MRLRLIEADRERLNCPEFLPVTFASVSNKEAIQLKKLGFPTVRILAEALQEVGQYEAWTALVWLALRRVGVDIDPEALEFSLPVELLDDEEAAEPVVVEGKAEEAPEASTN